MFVLVDSFVFQVILVALTAYQLLALMSAKFLTSFFGDW